MRACTASWSPAGRRWASLPGRTNSPRVEATLKAFRERPERLVVIDNLDHPALLVELLPRLGGVRLLVTTRRLDLPGALGMAVQHLDTFSPLESRRHLRKAVPRLKRAGDAALDRLAERLGRMPLALHLAASYLEVLRELSPDGYLAEIDRAGSALAVGGLPESLASSPTQHGLDLYATFRLSWALLGETDEDRLARRFFCAAGYCAPNVPIPLEVFRRLMGEGEGRPDFALRRLEAVGLVERVEQGVVLHPLLAEMARMLDGEAPESALPALGQVLVDLSYELTGTGFPADFLPLRPHLVTAAEALQAQEAQQTATLYNNLGVHLKVSGDLTGARPYLEQALAIRRAVLGEQHPDTAQSLNNLGSLLQAMGDPAGARRYFEQALAILEATLPPGHPYIRTVRNNLASLPPAVPPR